MVLVVSDYNEWLILLCVIQLGDGPYTATFVR